MGLIPDNEEVVVQKTHTLFIPACTDRAKSIAIVDTRGVTDRNFQTMPFRRIKGRSGLSMTCGSIGSPDDVFAYERARSGKVLLHILYMRIEDGSHLLQIASFDDIDV